MIYSDKHHFNCITLFIISILCFFASLTKAESELLMSPYITTCEPNEADSIIFSFNSPYSFTLNDTQNFRVDENGIRLKTKLSSDTFNVEIVFASPKLAKNVSIRIQGEFLKTCQDSYTSSCTVIIAFLASLCLILFTALALALIILRRKKPITFKFGQQSEKDDNDRVRFNTTNDYEENLNEPRKQSVFDVPNGVTANNISVSPVIETTPTLPYAYPRKSSLKPPKNEQIINNNYKKSSAKSNTKANSSHENAAYIGTDLEKVEEEIEDKTNKENKGLQETRRKSIVTFSDKTDVLPYS